MGGTQAQASTQPQATPVTEHLANEHVGMPRTGAPLAPLPFVLALTIALVTLGGLANLGAARRR
jgi:hypothetical protein